MNDESVLTRSFHCPLVLFLTAQETEDLERPRERRRRNSDSTLYCNSRAQVIAQSEGGAEAKHLDSEKYERQRQNMTDSGITTHGESSDLEMQEISGKYNLLIIHCSGSQIFNNY